MLQAFGPRPPAAERLRGLFVIGEERTIEQDPAFALRILVDIAIRALSPAVNDPTTAVQVLGAIEDLLILIGESDLRGRGELRDDDGNLRVRRRDPALGGPARARADGDPRVRRDRDPGDAPDPAPCSIDLQARVRPSIAPRSPAQAAALDAALERRPRRAPRVRRRADPQGIGGVGRGGRRADVVALTLARSSGSEDARPRLRRAAWARMTQPYGETVKWEPAAPRIGLLRLLVSLAVLTVVGVRGRRARAGRRARRGPAPALLVALSLALLNAIVPPVLAALRLPFMVAIGFILILLVDAALLLLVDEIFPDWLRVDGFADALLMSLVIAAVGIVLQVISGTNDDDEYTLRVTRRIARRLGTVGPHRRARDHLPRDRRPGAAGAAARDPRRQRADDGALDRRPRLPPRGVGDRPVVADRRQPGGHPARLQRGHLGLPLGREGDGDDDGLLLARPTARRSSAGTRPAIGLLADGGASRGNLLSGEAEEAILTVSRMDAEKRANPGYRAFLANGFNVTRLLVLYFWEVVLEWTAAARQKRRDVRPRGHRGGSYPFLRGAMCVFIRDLIVYGVLTDMMRGRPAVYATFASYDEVAHHSGLERADTLEALRKLDQQFARIENARRYAPRPYEIVVLSDHGQTQGATFKQRHGYGLDELVERSLARGRRRRLLGRRRAAGAWSATRSRRRRARADKRAKNDVSGRDVVVLGSGNLGLDLSDGLGPAADAGGDPGAPPEPDRSAARAPAHRLVARALAASTARSCSGRTAATGSTTARVEGEDPLAPFSPTAPAHLRRTDGFAARRRHHGRQLLRPRARRGLRLRGADLLPRRARRPADAPVHPVSAVAPAARRADRRRGRGPRGAARVAHHAAVALSGAGAGSDSGPAPLSALRRARLSPTAPFILVAAAPIFDTAVVRSMR